MKEKLGLASRDLLDGETKQSAKGSQCEFRHCTMLIVLPTPGSNAKDDGHQACQNQNNQIARTKMGIDSLEFRHAPFACLSPTTPTTHS